MPTTKRLFIKRLLVGVVVIIVAVALCTFGRQGSSPAVCSLTSHSAPPMIGLPPMGIPISPPMGMAPFLLEKLDLSDTQQDKAFALMHEQIPKAREQIKVATKNLKSLQQLSASGNFSAQKARGFADAHAQALSQAILMYAEADAKVRALLTPQQTRQLDDLRADMSPLQQ